MNETLGWLMIWSSALWVIGMLRKKLPSTQPAKALLLPGLALDACIRGLPALCTATPIHAIAPFADGKPLYEEGPTKIRYLGLPIAIMLRWLLLLIITYMTLIDRPDFLDTEFALPLLDSVSVEETGVEWHPLSEFWSALRGLPDALEIASPWSMLIAYMFITYFVGAGFTTREYLSALGLVGSLWTITGAFSWLGVTFGFFSRGWFIQWLYVPELWSAFSLIVVGTLCSALILGTARLLIHMKNSMAAPTPQRA